MAIQVKAKNISHVYWNKNMISLAFKFALTPTIHYSLRSKMKIYAS